MAHHWFFGGERVSRLVHFGRRCGGVEEGRKVVQLIVCGGVDWWQERGILFSNERSSEAVGGCNYGVFASDRGHHTVVWKPSDCLGNSGCEG